MDRVKVQMSVHLKMNSPPKLHQLLLGNGFSLFTYNQLTNIYRKYVVLHRTAPEEDSQDTIIICLYNGIGFPPQSVIKAINESPSVIKITIVKRVET